MLRLPKNRIARIALYTIFVIVALFTISLFFPIHADICTYSQHTKQEECSTHHVTLVGFWFLLNFLDDYSAVITAVATALLAFITWRLVVLGRDQSITSRAQLRAYLSVVIGEALYQETANNISFEGKPAILNNGQTPAYNVSYVAKAEILTDSVANSFTFSPPGAPVQSQSSIGPREQRLMSAVLPYMVPDADIQDIKDGKGKALWVWGVVHYEDVFHVTHSTQFCQRLVWIKDGRVWGTYDRRFGKSD